MRVALSQRASRDYRKLPAPLQRTAGKQFLLLRLNVRHPSLHAKKYDEARDVWQARVNDDFRFYFQIRGDVYYVITIVKHPK